MRTFLIASFLVFAAFDKPIVNFPTKDADSVRFPEYVDDSVTVCVQAPRSVDIYTCETLGDLRRDLLARRAAH